MARAKKGRLAAQVKGPRRTEQKEKFVQHYIQHGNGAEAYRHAYPNSRNWKNQDCCGNQAWKLLNYDQWVKDRITELRSKAEEKAVVSVARVLEEAARIAFSDPRKLFDENGNLKKIKDLDDETAAALAGFDVTTVFGGDEPIDVRKVRFWSKVDALEKLFKHLGLFKADNDQREKLVIVKDFTGAGNERTED